jgi:hypothetical protein
VLGALQYKPLLISTQTYATYNVKNGGQRGFNLKRVDAENEMFRAREEDLNWLQAMFISEPSQTKPRSPPYIPTFLSYYVLFFRGFHFPLIKSGFW